MHTEYIADSVPKELRLAHASTTVDHSLADTGSQEYLLPSHCPMELHGPGDKQGRGQTGTA